MSQAHILVVDDSATNNDMFCRLVESMDHVAISAANGTEALHYLEKHPSILSCWIL